MIESLIPELHPKSGPTPVDECDRCEKITHDLTQIRFNRLPWYSKSEFMNHATLCRECLREAEHDWAYDLCQEYSGPTKIYNRITKKCIMFYYDKDRPEDMEQIFEDCGGLDAVKRCLRGRSPARSPLCD